MWEIEAWDVAAWCRAVDTLSVRGGARQEQDVWVGTGSEPVPGRHPVRRPREGVQKAALAQETRPGRRGSRLRVFLRSRNRSLYLELVESRNSEPAVPFSRVPPLDSAAHGSPSPAAGVTGAFTRRWSPQRQLTTPPAPGGPDRTRPDRGRTIGDRTDGPFAAGRCSIHSRLAAFCFCLLLVCCGVLRLLFAQSRLVCRAVALTVSVRIFHTGLPRMPLPQDKLSALDCCSRFRSAIATADLVHNFGW